MTNRSMVVLALCAGCSSSAGDSTDGPDAGPGSDAPPGGDVVKAIFDAVAKPNLEARMNELTGAVPVTAGGSTFSITNRWSVSAKANFRAYWTQYMAGLG